MGNISTMVTEDEFHRSLHRGVLQERTDAERLNLIWTHSSCVHEFFFDETLMKFSGKCPNVRVKSTEKHCLDEEMWSANEMITLAGR